LIECHRRINGVVLYVGKKRHLLQRFNHLCKSSRDLSFILAFNHQLNACPPNWDVTQMTALQASGSSLNILKRYGWNSNQCSKPLGFIPSCWGPCTTALRWFPVTVTRSLSNFVVGGGTRMRKSKGSSPTKWL
jgi:hypothetical protein